MRQIQFDAIITLLDLGYTISTENYMLRKTKWKYETDSEYVLFDSDISFFYYKNDKTYLEAINIIIDDN